LRGKAGRPRIPCEHVAFIPRTFGDHLEWGEDKIAEEFDGNFGFHNEARPSPAIHGISPRGQLRSTALSG
jgi:hypothetical protein